MMSISYFFIWGNLEIQPFVTSLFYSKFIEKLSGQDMYSDVYYKYLESESSGIDFTNYSTGLNTKSDFNKKFQLEKSLYNYENEVLDKLGYEKKSIQKIENFTVGNLRKECELILKDVYNKELGKNIDHNNLTSSQIIKRSILNLDVINKQIKRDSLIRLKMALEDGFYLVENDVPVINDSDNIYFN